MRAALILAMAMTMVVTASDAEARGRRGGRSVGLGVGVGVSLPASRAYPAAQSASATDRTIVRPILPLHAPVQATASEIVKPASAGCTGRRVGQGSGFCELN